MRVLNKKLWPYQITLPRLISPENSSCDERYVWLRENIQYQDWYVTYTPTFCFKKEVDYLLFVLRWGA
jgi:hypothetical protein